MVRRLNGAPLRGRARGRGIACHQQHLQLVGKQRMLRVARVIRPGLADAAQPVYRHGFEGAAAALSDGGWTLVKVAR